MKFKEATILDVFVYPQNEKLWNDFSIAFRLSKWDPEETARQFVDDSYGLRARLDVGGAFDLAYVSLERLGPEYGVILP
ncbi:hypothetical protein [Cyclobacterium xiamenense]|uniref:hypothetical protein n=1 Tax=Cyclobacterium xiamenense TaxID=1297121 RepID=UPI0035CED41A